MLLSRFLLFCLSWSSVGGSGFTRDPGTDSPSPNTRSAGVEPMSGFIVVRIANRVHGSCQYHWSGRSDPNAISDSLRRRCNRSTNPFDSGWYAVVKWCLICHVLMSCPHRPLANWEPLSVVMDAGTPKDETIPYANASATVDAVMSERGTATGHRAVRSTAVRRY